MVHSTWDMASASDPMSKVQAKVVNCQDQLTSWDKKFFGNVRRSLAKKRKLLAEAEAASMSGVVMTR